MDYQKIYDNLIKSSKKRGLNKSSLKYYVESHHIIPSSVGGSNSDSNLVLLTASEHYLAHQLLIKISKKSGNLRYYYAMLLASRNMTINGSNTIRNNKEYSWIKELRAKAQSELYSGEGNPFYNKKHSDATKAMWSEKRKGSGNAMYGKSRPEISQLMSNIKRGTHWENYEELLALWKLNCEPGYVKFRKIAIANGFPDVRYQRMVYNFRGNL